MGKGALLQSIAPVHSNKKSRVMRHALQTTKTMKPGGNQDGVSQGELNVKNTIT